MPRSVHEGEHWESTRVNVRPRKTTPRTSRPPSSDPMQRTSTGRAGAVTAARARFTPSSGHRVTVPARVSSAQVPGRVTPAGTFSTRTGLPAVTLWAGSGHARVTVWAEASTAFSGTIWFCQVYWGIRFTSTSSTFGQARSVWSGNRKAVSPDGPAARHYLCQSSVSGNRARVGHFPSTKSCVNRHGPPGPVGSLATPALAMARLPVGNRAAGVPRKVTLDAFRQAFATLGYAVCDDERLEPGQEKIALFALSGEPRHAARQLPSGRWASKLGPMEDIEHELHDLTGLVYGSVVLTAPPAAPGGGRCPRA